MKETKSKNNRNYTIQTSTSTSFQSDFHVPDFNSTELTYSFDNLSINEYKRELVYTSASSSSDHNNQPVTCMIFIPGNLPNLEQDSDGTQQGWVISASSGCLCLWKCYGYIGK